MRVLTSVKMKFIYDIRMKSIYLFCPVTCDLNVLLFMSCNFTAHPCKYGISLPFSIQYKNKLIYIYNVYNKYNSELCILVTCILMMLI